jgi:hypothetical protein
MHARYRLAKVVVALLLVAVSVWLVWPSSQDVGSVSDTTERDVTVGRTIEARDDLVNVRPATVEAFSRVTPTSLLVTFFGLPCDGLARIDVTESSNDVNVGVFVGDLPESLQEGASCPALPVLYSSTVRLDMPLAARDVVDAHGPAAYQSPLGTPFGETAPDSSVAPEGSQGTTPATDVTAPSAGTTDAGNGVVGPSSVPSGVPAVDAPLDPGEILPAG